MPTISVKSGQTAQSDAVKAVEALANQIAMESMSALIFFCSPRYDLKALGEAIEKRFNCPAIGCTTAGEILSSQGYVEDRLIGTAIASDSLTLKPLFIDNLEAFVKEANPPQLEPLKSVDRSQSFTLLLIDGLSMLEERTIATIHKHLGGIPLVGGSAGDGLDFNHTFVYHEGRFHQNAAVLALFETSLPFKPFRIQHFEPTDKKLVITEADGATRTVMEINGLPAAEEYARAVGLEIEELTPQVFAAHPVMLRIGGEYFVRSIQKVNDDGSLTFFCAIDSGLVLTVAQPRNLLENLQANLSRVTEEIKEPAFIFGCDCILRRLEMSQRDELDQAKEILAPYPFIGFSTYGEQYGGIHVNHTLTGLAVGH
jgi:hypothetical protein